MSRIFILLTTLSDTYHGQRNWFCQQKIARAIGLIHIITKLFLPQFYESSIQTKNISDCYNTLSLQSISLSHSDPKPNTIYDINVNNIDDSQAFETTRLKNKIFNTICDATTQTTH